MTFYARRRRLVKWSEHPQRALHLRYLRRLREIDRQALATVSTEYDRAAVVRILLASRRALRAKGLYRSPVVGVRWSVYAWSMCYTLGVVFGIGPLVPPAYGHWLLPLLAGAGTWYGVRFMGGTLRRR